MDRAVVITEGQHETFRQCKCYPMFSWLAFGGGFSSFDMAESPTALTQTSYNLHKGKFLPICESVTGKKTTKMVTRLSSYLWLDPTLPTGKWSMPTLLPGALEGSYFQSS